MDTVSQYPDAVADLAGQLPRTSDPIDDCERYLDRVDTRLSEAFDPERPVHPLLVTRAFALDLVMERLWEAYLGGDAEAALLAVGGYGRSELFPYSDIDLLILLRDEASEQTGQKISALVTALWDIGLKVGHSVRTLAECASLARDDITVLTNMLEARLLCGDESLHSALDAAIAPGRMWDSASFFTAKLAEQSERHAKFANTESNLEPNVKNSPGGLRDIQVIGWVARRHYGVPIEVLRGEHFLNDDEHRLLDAGRDFMGRVRFALHTLAGREEDRLLFDHQRRLAQLWGFADGEKLAVEQFMQQYYRWAQALSQLNEHLMQIFDRSILHDEDTLDCTPIDADFEVLGGQLSARHNRVFADNPGNLLRAFVILANDEAITGLAAETWRLVRASLELIDDNFRAAPENRALFAQLLESPYGLTRQLRAMARHGILGRYLPEFGRVIGQMQFDLFHVYTVDAHTLEVLAYTRRFFRADFTDKFPVSTRIAQRLRKPSLLYIAALYHDIGKGRGGDHSELGAADAEAFCRHHGHTPEDTELVTWLVRNHLLMSNIAQRRDISDPEEIQRFAGFVGTEERLDYLYTLTVADINGTNPELWNAWRGSLLRQLYTETRRALRRGLENTLPRSKVVADNRRRATEILEYRGFFEEDLQRVWKHRGDDYFLRESPEDIAWHTEAVADHTDLSKPLVLVKQTAGSPVANATQILVLSRDTPELFARICAEIELLDLSINDARLYSGDDSTTLDTFFVLNADGTPVSSDDATIDGIRAALQRALEEGRNRTVSRHTPRQLKSFLTPTVTRITQDPDRGWTVLEVATPDRPGLLARISQIFVEQQVALQSAKIQTLGERVEDVFFITDRSGRAITDGDALCELTDRIAEVLDAGLRASA